jgi:acyl-CoA synthetase (AMP-forming)/AMP-acid ligase II
MWFGSFTCAIPAFDLDLFCRKMAEFKATWAHIVPPVAIALASSNIAAKYDLSSLKLILISAAPTKRDLQMKLKARFGSDTKIIQGEHSASKYRIQLTLAGYGMSECSPTVLLQSPMDNEDNIGTAGKPVAGT